MKPRNYFTLGLWAGICLGALVVMIGANQRWTDQQQQVHAPQTPTPAPWEDVSYGQ